MTDLTLTMAIPSTPAKTLCPQMLLPWRRFELLALVALLASALSCGRAAQEQVTLTFVDPEWSHDRSPRTMIMEANLKEFTQKTGIQVQHLPTPETALQQLDSLRESLHNQLSNVDVYGIDVIWTGLLADNLLDLNSPLAAELASVDPELLANYTANGKAVAIPYHTDVGVLLYRTDLLKKYGYADPPRTWDELEKMALRIQEGERAAGDKEFWGFIWPAAAGEGLTCIGLEWQASEGGGRIVEANRTISVNNPNTIRAWQRARHWIGWISPPTIVSYEEWDTINRFENSGRTAFRRGWSSDYFLTNPARSSIYGRMGVTSVPAGNSGSWNTLGGFGLGISRSSKHQAEAIGLVKFLMDKEYQSQRERESAPLPRETEVRRPPTVIKAFSRDMEAIHDEPGGRIISRPSIVTGTNYEAVSRAYAEAVHSVLTGQSSAPNAAAALETKLMQITGFSKGRPQPIR
jgi:trehalose/maltose transport system substrate-binding protein